MAKSLCKYRRIELADQFDAISQIVSVPNYICSSCARVASKKVYLCKPSALPHTAVHAPLPSVVSPTGLPVLTSAAMEAAPVASAVHEVVTTHDDSWAVEAGSDVTETLSSHASRKQIKKLTKLAKKKRKMLKKAAKAVKRYEKVLGKVKTALAR
ncbi:hypothetical protein L4C36_09450 [Photobacterium japonica]|uniref:hypothetical protein n=1 Tax=Photobacterium japonica TaxID=2910235 RepID=UPI003D0BF5D9